MPKQQSIKFINLKSFFNLRFLKTEKLEIKSINKKNK